jgi:hypothetical protein
MITQNQQYIVAIRETEGKEWPDTHTISGNAEASEDYADQEDKDAGPHWVEANPVVRFAVVNIVER